MCCLYMAFTKEALTTSDLSFIASAHIKAFVLPNFFLNHQVDVPTDYYTTIGNTSIINFQNRNKITDIDIKLTYKDIRVGFLRAFPQGI